MIARRRTSITCSRGSATSTKACRPNRASTACQIVLAGSTSASRGGRWPTLLRRETLAIGAEGSSCGRRHPASPIHGSPRAISGRLANASFRPINCKTARRLSSVPLRAAWINSMRLGSSAAPSSRGQRPRQPGPRREHQDRNRQASGARPVWIAGLRVLPGSLKETGELDGLLSRLWPAGRPSKAE